MLRWPFRGPMRSTLGIRFGTLATFLVMVSWAPLASAAPPITDFCSGWTLAGNGQCVNFIDFQAGQLANNCVGTETPGIVGSATSTSSYTLVSGASVVSYAYNVLSSDSVSYDGIIVQAIFNGQVYTLDTFNPGGNCVPQVGAHSFIATIPGITGGAVQVKLRVGVYQDNFGDLTWADISNLQMAP